MITQQVFCNCDLIKNISLFWESNAHDSECFHVKYEKAIRVMTSIWEYNQITSILVSWAISNNYNGPIEGIAAYCTCGATKSFINWISKQKHDHYCVRYENSEEVANVSK